jgi:hypothetical protein
MWEVDHNYDGRSPMGPGAIPVSNPAKTLSLSEDYGSGTHAISITDRGSIDDGHVHAFGRFIFANNDDLAVGTGATTANSLTSGQSVQGAGGTGSQPQSYNLATLSGKWCNTDIAQLPNNSTPPVQTELSLVHPVRGCFVLKRTARQNWVGA